MQISKLYETKITCSNYNPNIDDTITVTVALVDFNGNNVTGTNATITVNQGYFTKYTRNGSDTAISGTTTKSYTGTTGTDGTFTMTYKCSEWGLATFSANNTNVQSKVDGWREVQDLSLYSRLYVNENSKMAMATIRYLDRGNSDTKVFQLQNTAEFPAIATKYRPKQLVYSIADNQGITKLWMSTGGILSARYSTAGTYTLEAVLMWGY